MAGMSSAVRGLIPKSTGGRMALGAGAALAVAGSVVGYRSYNSPQRSARRQANKTVRNMMSGKDFENPIMITPQKEYEWQIEGGSTPAQARAFVNQYGVKRPTVARNFNDMFSSGQIPR